ncbi:MAG: hypothetical protein IPL65_06010 [Lewinellaceae bacterium]|nr:hypothetical protein [Lewinellaceae bacterium]
MLPEERESTAERLRHRSGIKTPMMILGVTMTLFYIGLGCYILLNKDFLGNIPADLRKVFAIMILVYGAYRGYRLYADHR